jgi:hypothetical protein
VSELAESAGLNPTDSRVGNAEPDDPQSRSGVGVNLARNGDVLKYKMIQRRWKCETFQFCFKQIKLDLL